MSKIDLQPIESLTNEQTFISQTNANYAEIETESDNFLSRDGTIPNAMAADLDMDGNFILNLPEATASGMPVRFDEFVLGVAGPTGATGATGAAGAAGADGTSPGFIQFYSILTIDSNPGSGIFRFNNSTIASATLVYLNNSDSSGSTVSTLMDTWDDSTNSIKGYLQFIEIGDPGTFAIFKVSGSVVDGTGYRKVSIGTPITAGTFSAGTLFSINFFMSGDKGTDGAGAGDVVGPASSTDNAIVRFDSTTGKLVQNSAVTVADTTGLIAGSRFANTGLKLEDTNASHLLTIAPGSDLTADRTLTITTGDAARTLTLSGDATISGSFSGTNTGDQTITLTTDVTGSGTGSIATTIANSAVTNAKMANMADQRLKGNISGGAAAPSDLTAAQVNTFLTQKSSFQFVIDGGGTAISTGIKGDLEVPFNCTINSVRLLADQTGSIVVDIWKDTYANYPPTVADTITAAATPTITAAVKSEDTTLTGWTTTLTAGNTLRFNVSSAATITRVTLSLVVTRT